MALDGTTVTSKRWSGLLKCEPSCPMALSLHLASALRSALSSSEFIGRTTLSTLGATIAAARAGVAAAVETFAVGGVAWHLTLSGVAAASAEGASTLMATVSASASAAFPLTPARGDVERTSFCDAEDGRGENCCCCSCISSWWGPCGRRRSAAPT